MDLRDYLNILFRRWVWAVLAFVLSMTAFFWFKSKEGESWIARAELNVNVANIFVQITPAKLLLPNYTNEQLLRQVLRSDEFFRHVQTIIRRESPGYTHYSEGPGGIARLRGGLSFRFDEDFVSGTEINAIELLFKSHAEKESRDMLDAVIIAFGEKVQQDSSAKTAAQLDSLRDVSRKYQEELGRKQSELDTLRETQQTRTAEVELSSSKTHLAKLDGLEAEKLLQVEKLKGDAAALRRAIEENKLVPSLLDPESNLSQWQQTVNELRFELNTMARKHTEDSPAMRDLFGRLHAAETTLAALTREYNQTLQAEQHERLRTMERQIVYEEQALQSLAAQKAEVMKRVDDLVKRQTVIEEFGEGLDNIQAIITDLKRFESDLEVKNKQKDVYINTIAKSSRREFISRAATQTYILVALLSIVAAMGMAYVVELLSVVIESEHDIRKYLNLPILMRVPRRRLRDPKLLTAIPQNESFAELFKNLSLMLVNNLSQRKLNVIEIASTSKEEGKSTIAANLAIATARLGHKTLLIDGDLRAPSLHRMLTLQKFGVFEFVNACTAKGELVSHEPFVQPIDKEPKLHVMAAGSHIENALEVLSHTYFRQLLATLREQYDYIIIDTPPIMLAAEALMLSEITDALYLVIAQGETNKKEAQEAVTLLTNAGAEVNGILFNKAYHHRFSGHAYYHKYYYSYSYGNRRK